VEALRDISLSWLKLLDLPQKETREALAKNTEIGRIGLGGETVVEIKNALAELWVPGVVLVPNANQRPF